MIVSQPSILDRAVVVGLPSQLSYVMQLQRRWSQELGFIPRAGLRRALSEKRVLVVRENRWPAGYVLWTRGRRGILHIAQAAVEVELLRSKLGSELLGAMRLAARDGGYSIVRLLCREELEANGFWGDAGFVRTGVLSYATSRGRRLNEWTLQLEDCRCVASVRA